MKATIKPASLGSLPGSELALGTMTFALNGGTTDTGFPVCGEKESHAILDAYYNAGGRLIDTADAYNGTISALITLVAPMQPPTYPIQIAVGYWSVYFVLLLGGESEHVIGSWLQARVDIPRSHITIATKVFFPTGEGDSALPGLSGPKLTAALQSSLQRLQTDYIDLYQVCVLRVIILFM